MNSNKALVLIEKSFGIGYNNNLLIKIPEDIKHFKKITSDCKDGYPIVIMGRKTYESIGKPLPKRYNIVISHNKNLDNIEIDNCTQLVVKDIEYARRLLIYNRKNKKFNISVIGGESIYSQLMEYVDELYMTIVDKDIKADKYFAPIITGCFELKKTIKSGSFDGAEFKINKYERKK